VEGERLVVSGRVVGNDRTPVTGAVLDVWQADTEGLYDLQRTAVEQSAYRLRGRMRTAANGTFRFTTVRPSPYPVPGGMRPAHIHVMISAEGYHPLVTELFFVGDPYLSEDPADQVRPDLIQAPVHGAEGCELTVEFALETAR
jgi:protocatechuate 3,4-dioxygenase beta subunit